MSKLLNIKQLETVCKQMNVLNKAFIVNGGGLIPLIQLKGSKQDIKEFLIDEEILLNNNGLKLLYEEEYTEANELDDGLYFFNNCDITSKNEIDVTGYHDAGIKYILDNIRLDGITKDALDSLNIYSVELFVNNTLLTHYGNSDDNKFTLADLGWIKDYEPREMSNTPATVKEESSTEDKEPVKEVEDVSKNEEFVSEEAELEPEPLETEQNEEDSEQESQPEVQEEPKEEPKENKKSESKKEKKSKKSKNNAPVPVAQEVNVDEIVNSTTDDLAAEEIAQNDKLLKEIRKTYQDTIDFISELRLSQWQPIKNKLEQALKENKFKDQLCVVYLDITDDVSTQLYAKLYELDELTANFNEEFIHQIKHFRCYSCSKEWDEDITFLEDGPHYISCPNCGAQRGFEK